MDEIEQRACAHDMALIEIVSNMDREHVVAAVRGLREGYLPGDPVQERMIRLQAISILEEALALKSDFQAGLFWLRDQRWLGDD